MFMILKLVPAKAVYEKYYDALRSTNSGWHPCRHGSRTARSTQRRNDATQAPVGVIGQNWRRNTHLPIQPPTMGMCEFLREAIMPVEPYCR